MADPDTNPVRRALIVGAVLVAILAALSGWLGVRVHQDRQSDRNREVLLTAARQCAENLTTISYSRVEPDVRRVLDCATGGFRDDFAARSESLMDVVRRARSISTGTVTEAGLESINGGEAVALVAVTVRTEVAGVGDGQPRYWRMRLTVVRDDAEAQVAKVAKVDFIR